MSRESLKRVLVVKLGAIGDVVMAVSAVHGLAERGSRIDWICGPSVAPLLESYSWIRTIVVDDALLLKGKKKERMREIWRLWRLLAGSRYDLCATLYYDARYRVLTLPVRARLRVHLSRNDRSRRIVPGRSHADELARILLPQEDTCRDRSRAPVPPDHLPPSPLRERRSPVRVALVPGGASNLLRQQALRRWPVEFYVTLAEQLLARGYEVVLTGGPGDDWVRPAFGRLGSPETLVDIIAKLALPEVISVFNDCDLVVSHDTGPLHLAGLSEAALVAIFGPTDPHDFLPRRNNVRALWGGEGFACRPCYDGRKFAPCRDNGCMRQVTVAMVLQQMDELLAQRSETEVRGWRVIPPSTLGGLAID